jgi:ComF family protein
LPTAWLARALPGAWHVRLARALPGAWHAWLDLLLPPACAGCGTPLAAEAALCRACAQPLGRPPRVPDVRGLAACLAAAGFEGPVEGWVHRFKYPARGLAGLDPGPQAAVQALVLAAAARAPGPPPDLVVPVPLHPRRLRQRGFNPAALLARSLARRVGVACDARALRRLRDTPSQTGLGRRARRRNLRDAFAATRPLPPCVWLVDDVVTTGSTLAEAARALRRGGARRVVGVCAAWTPD